MNEQKAIIDIAKRIAEKNATVRIDLSGIPYQATITSVECGCALIIEGLEASLRIPYESIREIIFSKHDGIKIVL